MVIGERSLIKVELLVWKTDINYNRMVLEDKIKRIQEKIRISYIKSTKLLFTNTGNIQASKNNLRKMHF